MIHVAFEAAGETQLNTAYGEVSVNGSVVISGNDTGHAVNDKSTLSAATPVQEGDLVEVRVWSSEGPGQITWWERAPFVIHGPLDETGVDLGGEYLYTRLIYVTAHKKDASLDGSSTTSGNMDTYLDGVQNNFPDHSTGVRMYLHHNGFFTDANLDANHAFIRLNDASAHQFYGVGVLESLKFDRILLPPRPPEQP